MRELHQSTLKHFFRCPKAFDLSMSGIEPNIGSNTKLLMRKGELFEGYAIGFKPDKDKDMIAGKMGTKTVYKIKADAEYTGDFLRDGKAYQKLHCAYDSNYSLDGEADYIGYMDRDLICTMYGRDDLPISSIDKYIIDIKYTGSIKRVWDYMNSPEDYLQAVMYCYMNYKSTGELLPFVYIVVESQDDAKPIIHVRKVAVSELSFSDWLLPLIAEVTNNLDMGELHANPCEYSCVGSRGVSGCWFLQHCTEGRKYIGGFKFVDFDELFNS